MLHISNLYNYHIIYRITLFSFPLHKQKYWKREIEIIPTNIGVMREISDGEVQKVVQGMKNGKALGPDSIPQLKYGSF